MKEVINEIKKTNLLLNGLNKKMDRLIEVCEKWFKDDIRQHKERLDKLKGTSITS